MLCRSPGRKAQPLAGLDGGAREDYPVHLLAPESADRLGHGEVGLARAGGAYPEGDGVLVHRVDIGLLAEGFGLYRLALGGDAHDVAAELAYLGLAPLAHELEDIPHVLRVYGLSAARELQKPVYGLLGGHDVLGLAGYAQLVVAVRHRDAELAFDNPQVLVKGAEDAYDVLHAVYRHSPFYHLFAAPLYIRLFSTIGPEQTPQCSPGTRRAG